MSALAVAVISTVTAAAIPLPGVALPERVKVRLYSSMPVLDRIYIYGPVEILQPQRQTMGKGMYVASTTNGGIVLRSVGGKGGRVCGPFSRLVIEGNGASRNLLKLASAPDASPRFYRGTVSIAKSTERECRARLTLINDVDTHSYVAGCVGGESPPSFGSEALKAQAVLSTTLLEKRFHGKAINDNTEQQVYLGASGERAAVKAAVDSVFGEELCSDGEPIDVFFCSTCGGTTASPAIFGGKVAEGKYPYLKAVKCSYCSRSPFSKNLREKVSAEKFFRATGWKNPAVEEEDNGRPIKVSVTQKDRRRSLTGYQFWLGVGQHLGWGVIPSNSFSIVKVGAGPGESLEFVSRGCGHGVGMCQWGAAGQARAGRGYKEILYFYFPGTKLKSLTGKSVSLLPPSAGPRR